MNIKTQFEVGDYVQHKLATPLSALDHTNLSTQFFEVVEIKTGTCIAGTQVYYECRSIFKVLETDGTSAIKSMGFHLGKVDARDYPYQKFREDELKVVPSADLWQKDKEIDYSDRDPEKNSPHE